MYYNWNELLNESLIQYSLICLNEKNEKKM